MINIMAKYPWICSVIFKAHNQIVMFTGLKLPIFHIQNQIRIIIIYFVINVINNFHHIVGTLLNTGRPPGYFKGRQDTLGYFKGPRISNINQPFRRPLGRLNGGVWGGGCPPRNQGKFRLLAAPGQYMPRRRLWLSASGLLNCTATGCNYNFHI